MDKMKKSATDSRYNSLKGATSTIINQKRYDGPSGVVYIDHGIFIREKQKKKCL